MLPASLLRKWHRRDTRYPICRNPIIDEDGVRLGVTLLAKFKGDELRVDEARIMALLSAAFGYIISDDVITPIRRAEKYCRSGDRTLALMELALSRIPALTTREQAQRLFAAECLLEWGDTPEALFKYAGLGKFNPYHLGTGPDGGQFTTADRDGQSNGLPPGAAGRRDTGTSLKPPTRLASGGVQVAMTAVEGGAIGALATVATIAAMSVLNSNKPTALHSDDAGEDNSTGSNAPATDSENNQGISNQPVVTKPAGIPDDWIEQPSQDRKGKQWINPDNSNDRVRVMPGNPNSKYPSQQGPYVVDQNGGFRDVNGKPIPGSNPGDTPEAHIPADQYKFRGLCT